MNSVICAATIEAINSGWEVYGIPDGFSDLMNGDTSRVHPLTLDDVSRIHLQAARLWLKRVGFHSKPVAPAVPVTRQTHPPA